MELVIGLTGAVDVCYRYGKAFVKTCQAFRDADSQFNEQVVRVEACWMHIESQLEAVRSLAQVMDQQHRLIHQEVVELLTQKLKIAHTKLDSLVKPLDYNLAGSQSLTPMRTRRWKYALVRESLIDAISDLEAWRQRIFDPTWLLLMKVALPKVDSQSGVLASIEQSAMSQNTPTTARDLQSAVKSHGDDSKRSIVLPPDRLLSDSNQPILFSSASTARRKDNGQRVLLDLVTCVSRPSVNSMLREMRPLVRKLRHVDPFNSGLLRCKGVIKNEGETSTLTAPDESSQTPGSASLSLVFSLPEDRQEVQGLRWCLLHWHESDFSSLSERFALAQQMVCAVSYVHSYGFVHKNIRPETILILSSGAKGAIFSNEDGKTGIPDKVEDIAVLAGFDILRNADGRSNLLGDDDWEKNLYRHPTRQSTSPEVYYEMRHDIYSIGVCLLEIGLWESFVIYCVTDKGQTARDELQPRPSQALLEEDHSKTPHGHDTRFTGCLRDPYHLKDWLVKLARGRLRRKMGTRYSQVVETCLTCLDEANLDFGDEKEFQDEDGVAVGVRYIEKVVAKLSDIAV